MSTAEAARCGSAGIVAGGRKGPRRRGGAGTRARRGRRSAGACGLTSPGRRRPARQSDAAGASRGRRGHEKSATYWWSRWRGRAGPWAFEAELEDEASMAREEAQPGWHERGRASTGGADEHAGTRSLGARGAGGVRTRRRRAGVGQPGWRGRGGAQVEAGIGAGTRARRGRRSQRRPTGRNRSRLKRDDGEPEQPMERRTGAARSRPARTPVRSLAAWEESHERGAAAGGKGAWAEVGRRRAQGRRAATSCVEEIKQQVMGGVAGAWRRRRVGGTGELTDEDDVDASGRAQDVRRRSR